MFSTSPRLSRLLTRVAAVVALAVILGLAGPAMGETKSKKDKVGDARSAALDISRVTVRYGHNALRVKAQFAGDLAGTGRFEFMYAAAPSGYADPTLYVTFVKKSNGKKVVMVRHFQEYSGEGPRLKGCKPKGSWSIARDAVVVTLPPGCYTKKPAKKKTLDVAGIATYEAVRASTMDWIGGRFRVSYN